MKLHNVILNPAEKYSIAGQEHKVCFACWFQNGMLVPGLLVPSMGSGSAGGSATLAQSS